MSLVCEIIWTVNPDIIKEPIMIRWYGVLFASGFLAGYYLLQKMFVSENKEKEWVDKVFVSMMIGTVLGARLGHVFFYDWSYYSQNLGEILMIWKGGLASHGAAIGILIGFWWFSKKISKEPMLWIADRATVFVAFAGGLIRFGNLLNHEIIGMPTDLPWAFVFTRVDMIPRHPAQLYEALCYFILFGILMYMYWKTNAKDKTGLLFGTFLTGVFTARFFIEFIKENQSAFEEGMALNMGQILSIPLVVFGVFLIYNASRKRMRSSD